MGETSLDNWMDLIEELPFAVIGKDFQEGVGQYFIWNKMAETLLGVKKEEVLGNTGDHLKGFSKLYFLRHDDHELLKSDRVISSRHERLNVCRFSLRGRFIVGLLQENPEMNALESEVKVLRDRAEEAMTLLHHAEVARQMAHEINNPLAIILGRAFQLKKTLQHSSAGEPLLGAVESIIETVYRTSNSVNLLLDVYGGQGPTGLLTDAAEMKVRPKSTILHDFANLITIAHGKSKMAERLLNQTAPLTPEQLVSLKVILGSTINALERMTARLDQETGNVRAKS